jgi:hypothetical protein
MKWGSIMKELMKWNAPFLKLFIYYTIFSWAPLILLIPEGIYYHWILGGSSPSMTLGLLWFILWNPVIGIWQLLFHYIFKYIIPVSMVIFFISFITKNKEE